MESSSSFDYFVVTGIEWFLFSFSWGLCFVFLYSSGVVPCLPDVSVCFVVGLPGPDGGLSGILGGRNYIHGDKKGKGWVIGVETVMLTEKDFTAPGDKSFLEPWLLANGLWVTVESGALNRCLMFGTRRAFRSWWIAL